MNKIPEQPGLAVLTILVERHQRLLEGEGVSLTPEEALASLLVRFCRYDHERILAAVRAALEECGLDIHHLLHPESNGTTHH